MSNGLPTDAETVDEPLERVELRGIAAAFTAADGLDLRSQLHFAETVVADLFENVKDEEVPDLNSVTKLHATVVKMTLVMDVLTRGLCNAENRHWPSGNAKDGK